MDRPFPVEVVYATPEVQASVMLTITEGTTLRQAIQSSGLLERFPEIRLGANPVGVFGELRALDAAVQAGDRVEIYRPLLLDPKAVRRRRAGGGR